MSRVVIVVDGDLDGDGEIVEASQKAVLGQMVSALTEAVTLHSSTPPPVKVVGRSQLEKALVLPQPDSELLDKDIIWCPLTLNLSSKLLFPGQKTFQACKQEADLRQWVTQQLGYATGESQRLETFVLPVVYTAKGPLYGEVIGNKEIQGYYQPVDLPDKQRQPLYHLAQQLLQFLAAPPAVYLLEFSDNQQDIVFNKLIPFPAAPAIASLGVQTPDLFTCHWLCLTGQPIFDLIITPTGKD